MSWKRPDCSLILQKGFSGTLRTSLYLVKAKERFFIFSFSFLPFSCGKPWLQ